MIPRKIEIRCLPACSILLFFLLLIMHGLFGQAEFVSGAEIPGTIVIDSLSKKYGPVTFDHGMHAGLAEDCGKCHHQHSNKLVSVCKECHAIDPSAFKASAKQGFLPCSGCHTEYSPDSPEVPGLKVALHKKCFQCHIGIGKLGASPEGCNETCHSKK